MQVLSRNVVRRCGAEPMFIIFGLALQPPAGFEGLRGALYGLCLGRGSAGLAVKT